MTEYEVVLLVTYTLIIHVREIPVIKGNGNVFSGLPRKPVKPNFEPSCFPMGRSESAFIL